MNQHEEFCQKLGNQFYTRLEYTDEDRELRTKLEEDIKNNSQSNDANNMRGIEFHEQNQALKKFQKMSKNRLGKFTGNNGR